MLVSCFVFSQECYSGGSEVSDYPRHRNCTTWRTVFTGNYVCLGILYTGEMKFSRDKIWWRIYFLLQLAKSLAHGYIDPARQ